MYGPWRHICKAAKFQVVNKEFISKTKTNNFAFFNLRFSQKKLHCWHQALDSISAGTTAPVWVGNDVINVFDINHGNLLWKHHLHLVLHLVLGVAVKVPADPTVLTFHPWCWDHLHIMVRMAMMIMAMIMMVVREAITCQLCSFFKHCLNGLWPPPPPSF